jgi:hypothetical protein
MGISDLALSQMMVVLEGLAGPSGADFVAEVGDCNGEATPPIFWNGLSQPPCLRGWALPGG